MQILPEKTIKFFFQSHNITLRERKRLKWFLNSILTDEKRKLSYINYIFCSDEDLLSINRNYLKHNYYTDIITFDLSSVSKIIEAEIYISTDRVRDNAKSFHTSIDREIHRVMFHGVLHLCGYKDKTPAEQKKMRQKEDYYLKKYKRF